MGAWTGDSCRGYFKKVFYYYNHNIYSCSYFLLLIKKAQFAANSEIQSISIRSKSIFHQPLSILTSYFKKNRRYFDIKVFSCLLEQIKNLSHNMKLFKSALIRFLPTFLGVLDEVSPLYLIMFKF